MFVYRSRNGNFLFCLLFFFLVVCVKLVVNRTESMPGVYDFFLNLPSGYGFITTLCFIVN